MQKYEILRAEIIRQYGEALDSKTKCLPGCKLFNHHKHLKLGLLLFQLIYGPYQDFYDLNLLQNTYQRTSHNFLFIFNHSKCDMMLVVLLKFTGVSTTGYLLTQYFYVATSVCYVHPWPFWQRKTGKLFRSWPEAEFKFQIT